MWHKDRLTWSQRPSVETSAMPMAAKSKALRKRSLSLVRPDGSLTAGAGLLLRSPKKRPRATKARRHANAPTETETPMPKDCTHAANVSADANAAELPTICQKSVRAASRKTDWLIRYEPPKAMKEAFRSDWTSTATQTALSVAGERLPTDGMSVRTPEVSRSVQTTKNVVEAATDARKKAPYSLLLSGREAQSATDAAKSTAASPSKSSIERKAKLSAKGKCQPSRAAGGASKLEETRTAKSTSRRRGKPSWATGSRKSVKSTTIAPVTTSVWTNCCGKRWPSAVSIVMFVRECFCLCQPGAGRATAPPAFRRHKSIPVPKSAR